MVPSPTTAPPRSRPRGRSLNVLLRTEIRRLRPYLLRLGAWVVVGVPLLLALDARAFLLFFLLGFGSATVVQVPAELVRDRINGDLLHLCVLPVAASTVAGAKFLASVLLSILAALLYAVSAALAMPEVIPSLTPLAAAALTFFTCWLLFSVSSFVAVALVSRLRLQALTGGSVPLILLGVLVGSGWLLERWIPDPWAAAEWLLAQSWLLAVSVFSGLFVAALVAWIAFRVTAAGIRDYRPEPDSLTW